jgi:hypothetical protein
MQRRQFIQLSAMSGTVMLVTGMHCGRHHPVSYDVLSQPADLAQICDLKTLREIGMIYRLQITTEMDADKLADLLLTDSAGKRLSSDAEAASVQALIHEKVNRDFESGETVTVGGWVLSQTEARQCVLLFMNNP